MRIGNEIEAKLRKAGVQDPHHPAKSSSRHAEIRLRFTMLLIGKMLRGTTPAGAVLRQEVSFFCARSSSSTPSRTAGRRRARACAFCALRPALPLASRGRCPSSSPSFKGVPSSRPSPPNATETRVSCRSTRSREATTAGTGGSPRPIRRNSSWGPHLRRVGDSPLRALSRDLSPSPSSPTSIHAMASSPVYPGTTLLDERASVAGVPRSAASTRPSTWAAWSRVSGPPMPPMTLPQRTAGGQ